MLLYHIHCEYGITKRGTWFLKTLHKMPCPIFFRKHKIKSEKTLDKFLTNGIIDINKTGRDSRHRRRGRKRYTTGSCTKWRSSAVYGAFSGRMAAAVPRLELYNILILFYNTAVITKKSHSGLIKVIFCAVAVHAGRGLVRSAAFFIGICRFLQHWICKRRLLYSSWQNFAYAACIWRNS